MGRLKKQASLSWVLLLLCVLLVPAVVPHLLALRLPGPPRVPSDAVIVLSGGGGRIQAGYKAWKAGIGRDLCILGAGRGVRPARLLPGADALPPEVLTRIRVEGWSENTLENAFSAKSLVEKERYASVVLVTSDYHVPRAHIAFRKVLPPDVALTVLRVRDRNGDTAGSAWRWTRRHFLEGWKYWGYRILLPWE